MGWACSGCPPPIGCEVGRMSVTEPLEKPSPLLTPRLRLLLWIVVPIVSLVALFFIADGIVRAYAEGRVASEIEKSLPENVSGDVSVHIGGLSVIQQYLSG